MSVTARSRLLSAMRPILVLAMSTALVLGGASVALADTGSEAGTTSSVATMDNPQAEGAASEGSTGASSADPTESTTASEPTSSAPSTPESTPTGSDPTTDQSTTPATPTTDEPTTSAPTTGPTTPTSPTSPTSPPPPSSTSAPTSTAGTPTTRTPTGSSTAPPSTRTSPPVGSSTTDRTSSTTPVAPTPSSSTKSTATTSVSTDGTVVDTGTPAAADPAPAVQPTVQNQITWEQDSWNDAISSGGSGGSTATSCPGAEPVTEAEPEYQAARFGGVLLTADQQRTAVTVIAVGKALKIDARGIRVALAAAMQESSLQAWAVHDRYVGLYQQLYDPTTGLYGEYDRLDPVGASRMFYAQLTKLVPKYAKDTRPDWQIAEAVQQTNVGRYFDGQKPIAVALLKKYLAGTAAYSIEPKPEPVCDQSAIDPGTGGGDATGVSGAFDPGMIISDEVFYNSKAMTEAQIRSFLQAKGASCSGPWCLRNLKLTTTDQPADRYCAAFKGAPNDDAAAVLHKVSVACHLNPQVMLVTLEKESGLLDRSSVSQSSYAAAFGWHCPDSGPGGSANCDPAYAGFFAQTYGMAKQWSRYRVDPQKYHYQSGETTEVLWNVAETGCGGSQVHIRNVATASLYNYTPYQPNAASLAAYPGTGDACSSYGNRNFYYLFGQYFGTTGGVAVTVKGVAVTIPDNPAVPGALVGAKIQAPNAAMAKGIAAGFAALGTPYVWGGGTNGGPADEGCGRGGGASNSCAGIVGFDCSGLTGYVLSSAGYIIGDNSAAQRSAGKSVPWSAGRPGDIAGWPGHVAIYLGTINGVGYVLEAPDVGRTVSIRAVYGSPDSSLHRYWS